VPTNQKLYSQSDGERRRVCTLKPEGIALWSRARTSRFRASVLASLYSVIAARIEYACHVVDINTLNILNKEDFDSNYQCVICV
jgi:hypothetical protein